MDDHESVRRTLRQLLEQHHGWMVCSEANDGKEAVTEFAATHPDVAVIDFQMPEANGLEASKKIIQQFPDASILMMTAHPTKQLMTEAKSAGIKGFCSKINVDCIVDAVFALLNGGTYFQN